MGTVIYENCPAKQFVEPMLFLSYDLVNTNLLN